MRAYDSNPQENATEYTCAEDCFRDYFDVIANEGYYDAMLNNFNIEDSVTNGLASYATDPNYRSSIISIANGFGLMQYDNEIQAYISDKTEVSAEVEQVSIPTENVSPQVIGELAHGTGEEVDYFEIYATANSVQPLAPYFTHGAITQTINGARNPYMIGNGTGFINDGSIVGATVTQDVSAEEVPQERVQEVVEEGFRTYTVQPGDSFCRISSNVYGNESKAQEIADLNNLNITDTIWSNTILRLPN